MNPVKQQRYDVEYKTLTPVHVGSGQVLMKGLDFIVKDKYAHILDDRKLLDAVREQSIDKWTSAIENQKDIMPFLESRLGKNFNAGDLSSLSIPLKSIEKTAELRMAQIGLKGEYLLPGSSIKGAVRTALFADKIKQRKNILQPVDFGKKKDYDRSNKISDSELLKNAFGPDANFNFMRFLAIGDVLFPKDSHTVFRVDTMNQNHNGVEKKGNGSSLVDAIKKDSKANGAIILNLQGWEKLKNSSQGKTELTFEEQMNQLKSIDDFLEVTYNHTCDLIQAEFNYWDNRSTNGNIERYLDELEVIYKTELEVNETILRVGYGSGWMWMTGGWTEAKINNTGEKMSKLFSDDIQLASSREGYLHDYPLPKTRKLTSEASSLGFIKLKIKNYGPTNQ